MKETGIIMSGDHPLKLLDGTKTMTRRVIKADCNCTADCCKGSDYRGQILDWVGYKYSGREHWFCHSCGHGLKHIDEFSAHGFICPYGQVGDRLWVRETHYHYGNWRLTGEITKTGKPEWEFVPSDYRRVNYFDNPPSNYLTRPSEKMGWYKRPSIFMPRWASRITLEITEVRVERLQEITTEDILAEGVLTEFHNGDLDGMFLVHADLFGQFENLWDSLNAKRGYPWEKNQWVWAISF